MSNAKLEKSIEDVFKHYQESFSKKTYDDENNVHDVLMKVFSITPELKRENRQYWGRELGMCWQLVVNEVFRQTRDDYTPPLRIGNDEPCDLTIGKIAIDTKYRVGSGDSGTLKKFKTYGHLLREEGYEPYFLILRRDNLKAAISAVEKGTWNTLIGMQTFEFIYENSGFDLYNYLIQKEGAYAVYR